MFFLETDDDVKPNKADTQPVDQSQADPHRWGS